MTLAFTDNGLWPRFNAFIATLRARGHEICIHPDKSILPRADMWFVDFHQTKERNICTYMVEQFNKYESSYLTYGGKLIFYTIDDGGASYLNGASQSIKERLDAWITLVKHPVGECRPEEIAHKFILIPRYLIDYRPPGAYIKQNRVIFIGNTTGGWNYDNGNKNLRVECTRRIRGSALNTYFMGGFVGDHLIDCPNSKNHPYCIEFAPHAVSNISTERWNEWMNESFIYLHLAGNSRWSYRQPQAMQAKTTVITPPLINDPGEWFMQDIFSDCFYYMNPDYSNMEDVIEYALYNTKETIEKADHAYRIYNQHLSLTPDGIYQDHIWNMISENLQRVGIYL
jgi:hypothetical protein